MFLVIVTQVFWVSCYFIFQASLPTYFIPFYNQYFWNAIL